MTGEVLKWGSLAILFAHEQHRHKRRKQGDSGGELQRFEIHQAAKPLAGGAIAYLVVILIAYNKFCRRDTAG